LKWFNNRIICKFTVKYTISSVDFGTEPLCSDSRIGPTNAVNDNWGRSRTVHDSDPKIETTQKHMAI